MTAPLKTKVGKKFGMLTVLRRCGKEGRKSMWECRCDCGRIVEVSDGNLAPNCRQTKSCGCLRQSHGKSKTPEYAAYMSAKNRCINPNASKYGYYGGRGIHFLYRDFNEFYADVGPRPSLKHTLDRKDTNGDYVAGNCRWATRAEQLKNRRLTLRIDQFSSNALITECRRRGLEVGYQQYLPLEAFFEIVPQARNLRRLWDDHKTKMETAPGSSHNHQAWEGGYQHHIVECLNIVCWLHSISKERPLPFSLGDALIVLFLHDVEKPFAAELKAAGKYSKPDRKQFRADLIARYGIELTPEQENALQYVEGVPDSQYTPGSRTMGELAAFCHCCDILSARLWHDKGRGHSWEES